MTVSDWCPKSDTPVPDKHRVQARKTGHSPCTCSRIVVVDLSDFTYARHRLPHQQPTRYMISEA